MNSVSLHVFISQPRTLNKVKGVFRATVLKTISEVALEAILKNNTNLTWQVS
jgi:hypothetical protein